MRATDSELVKEALLAWDTQGFHKYSRNCVEAFERIVAQNKRLMSRGFEDLHHENEQLTAKLATIKERLEDPGRIAALFHLTYEQLAPNHGYKTRDESAVPWSEVPEANRALMVEVASVVCQSLRELVAAADDGEPNANQEEGD